VVRVRSGERLPSRRSPFQRPQHWHVPFGTSGRGPVGPFGLRLWWLPALSRDLAHQAPARLRAAPPARQSGPRHSRDTSASLAGAGSCRATAPGCASTRPWRWKPPTRAGPAGESTRGRRPRRLAGVGDRPGAGRPDQDAGADRPDQGRSVRAGAGGLRTAAHPARSWANWSKCWPSTWRHPRGRTLLGRTPSRARRVDPEVGLGQAEQVGSLTGRCGHGLMKRPRRFTLPRVVPDQDASTQGPRPPKRSGVITST
jgi:hypothetical protein